MAETLFELADALNCMRPAEDRAVANVTTDTRRIAPGDLFVALRGASFDGHDFIDQALEQGAVAVVCEPGTVSQDVPSLIVPDTRLAFGLIARARRRRWEGRLLAVTGNSGKTTVKEMLGAIASRHASTLVTEGNLNNDFGAPMTLLRLEAEHRLAVVELGANHIGEIAWTASLARPEVAVITNVTGAHIGEFGSRGLIAQAKGELVQALPDAGTAVLNVDDDYFPLWAAMASPRRVIGFGLDPRADITAREIEQDARGCCSFELMIDGDSAGRVTLGVLGRYNVSNALAAAAGAWSLGVSFETIRAGLEAFRAGKGRMRTLLGLRGACVLDDTYNANPGAMRAAIDVVAAMPAPRWCVLGAMGELGEHSAEAHRALGDYARDKGIDTVCTFGPEAARTAAAFGANGHHFERFDTLEQFSIDHLPAHASVLIKGSRSARMERLVDALTAGAFEQG
ncbi:UDP-N-acetylmuramoyl-tripeptide--D-alanyl-D-alanine ligase [Larsenimonas suaedae]|uniref:UDP-N-acetylmuramoyl-tripeptide--D-alanyl-D-alanine ligase n=1 Tax=Larsenimonas suaedae TaxID=1851019 RepID=A0ABU1GUM0_9GAMM|nr:UDP-N-acetylmuramoyl-tripeptide--D-alanyl-D-alanine ligase [Larsenimonas suaedae]MCM2971035.1 UDP-N-acetylmuramoyl-tripeptide--D-alanyl-D-alanine ligase [Larsenimonas suaedae]MDR5895744.1 UDP-N-acetylmuramoyl-tripeptide--D-alanyl-D-alanine ligase [Larsenimonas suaedae]